MMVKVSYSLVQLAFQVFLTQVHELDGLGRTSYTDFINNSTTVHIHMLFMIGPFGALLLLHTHALTIRD
jgi:hypothetical protein